MKKQPAEEFSRPLQVDRVPALGSRETVEATPSECAEVAKRLQLPAIHSLRAKLHAEPWRGGLKLSGKVGADFEQLSVISLEPFRTQIEYDIDRYFMPPRADSADGDDDIDPIENGLVDLGELVVESLALELDPYPRRPGEKFEALEQAGQASKANPFDALKRFKP